MEINPFSELQVLVTHKSENLGKSLFYDES